MFFKFVRYFLLCFLFSNFCFGQTLVSSDSLIALLRTKMADTSRVLLFDRLALNLMKSKPFDALQYANEGMELSRKIDYKIGQVRLLNRLGTIFRRTDNYTESLKKHFDAIRLAESIDDKEGLGKIYNNLGVFYTNQKDYKKALENDFKAKYYAEITKNQNLFESALNNIGADYISLNQLDSAKYYLEKVYILEHKNKNSYEFVTLSNLGNIDFFSKNYDEAIKKYLKCIEFFKQNGDESTLSETYYQLANVYKAINNSNFSKIYAEKSSELSKRTNNTKFMYNSNLLLSELLEKDNLGKSFDHYKVAMAAKDSMYSIEKIAQLQSIDFQEKMKQQQLLDSKREFDNKLRIWLLLALIGTFLLITIIQFRNNKHKQKANLKLLQQNDAIETQKVALHNSLETLKLTQNQLIQQEKLASLGELTAGIAHEIQNPLNFVNNFSEINSDLIKEIQDERKKENPELDIEKELLEDLAVNQEKIQYHGKRASDIVKTMLDHSRNNTGQRTMVDVNKLADEFIRLSFLGLRSKYKNFNAEYKLDLDPNLPNIEAVSQDIGRVLLNLFNNAFYAVYLKKEHDGNNVFQPQITVITKYYGDLLLNNKIGYVEISVQDNGNGVSEELKSKILLPFFTTKPTGEGTGLGLSLSNEIITRSHKGSLSIESKEGEGAAFIVKLPV